MTGLFYAHSGLRYLVLLAAIVAIGYHFYGLRKRIAVDGTARGTAAAFTGLLDLQIVLGLIFMATGVYHGALIGHIVLMLLAAGVAHMGGKLASRKPDAADYYRIRVAAMSVALVLIVLGIAAIGRSVFGSGAPPA